MMKSKCESDVKRDITIVTSLCVGASSHSTTPLLMMPCKRSRRLQQIIYIVSLPVYFVYIRSTYIHGSPCQLPQSIRSSSSSPTVYCMYQIHGMRCQDYGCFITHEKHEICIDSRKDVVQRRSKEYRAAKNTRARARILPS